MTVDTMPESIWRLKAACSRNSETETVSTSDLDFAMNTIDALVAALEACRNDARSDFGRLSGASISQLEAALALARGGK